MGDHFPSQILLCWPSDRASIQRLNNLVGPSQSFSPTVEHSLSTCEGCGRSVWIAEQQRQLAASPLIVTRILCMFCAGEVQKTLDLNAQEVDIGPTVRSARRRIT